jgi:hypothetical protein
MNKTRRQPAAMANTGLTPVVVKADAQGKRTGLWAHDLTGPVCPGRAVCCVLLVLCGSAHADAHSDLDITEVPLVRYGMAVDSATYRVRVRVCVCSWD